MAETAGVLECLLYSGDRVSKLRLGYKEDGPRSEGSSPIVDHPFCFHIDDTLTKRGREAP